MFRALTLDECDVGLMSEEEIPMAMSGEYNKMACEKEDTGEQGWQKGASGCQRDDAGEPTTRRDCQFRNTGDIVLQVRPRQECVVPSTLTLSDVRIANCNTDTFVYAGGAAVREGHFF